MITTNNLLTGARSSVDLRSARWTTSLRVACQTLRRSSPLEIKSITVILPIDGSADWITAAGALVEEIAAQHGLVGRLQSSDSNQILKAWFGRDGIEGAGES